MPSSYETLRAKFITDDDDGIGKAEDILLAAGYTRIRHGVFREPKTEDVSKYTHGEILDAAQYLCWEWDYAIEGAR